MWIIFINSYKKRLSELPQRPLTDQDILEIVKKWRIKRFRGIFSRDGLPKRIHHTETGIVNLDDVEGGGTHWVAYSKRGQKINYFDSYGDLRPPQELEKYLLSNGRGVILYNNQRYQKVNATNCGHLSLMFLKGLLK